MSMVFAVRLVGFLSVAIPVYVLIKKWRDNKKMMSHVYSMHGYIQGSKVDTEQRLGVGPTSYSVSSSGESFIHYTNEWYEGITGFTLFFVNGYTLKELGHIAIDEKPVTKIRSLDKNQTNPRFYYYDIGGFDALDGTIYYVIDKKGEKRYVRFRPDNPAYRKLNSSVSPN